MSNLKMSLNDKNYFTAILLLDNMINNQVYYNIVGKTKYLDDAFVNLMTAERVDINDKNQYVPTKKGREFLQKFMDKYYDYVKMYDVYCAVDVETGEFALSQYYDFNIGENPDEEYDNWQSFLSDERWIDLRVAVAQHKKLNPIELVFMSFINDDRFNTSKTGWEFDVYSGLFWDQIVDIANGMISLDDINNSPSGHDINLIIKAGTENILELHKIEEEIDRMYEDEDDEEEYEEEYEETVTYVEVIEEPIYEVSYIEYYYDPFYVSPYWDEYYDPYYY